MYTNFYDFENLKSSDEQSLLSLTEMFSRHYICRSLFIWMILEYFGLYVGFGHEHFKNYFKPGRLTSIFLFSNASWLIFLSCGVLYISGNYPSKSNDISSIMINLHFTFITFMTISLLLLMISHIITLKKLENIKRKHLFQLKLWCCYICSVSFVGMVYGVVSSNNVIFCLSEYLFVFTANIFVVEIWAGIETTILHSSPTKPIENALF